MRTLFLATAAFAALAVGAPIGKAHASTYLQCNDGFHQLRGKAGSNPPVSAMVARQDDGRWSVVYVLRDGQTVMRENQYDIADKGNGVGWTGWRDGKQMRASIEHYNGRLIYAEAVYAGGERLVGSNYIDCGPAPADEPDYTPPVQAYAPTPIVPDSTNYTPAPQPQPAAQPVPMPIASSGGGFTVALNDIPGVANNQTVGVTMGDDSVVYQMTVDTGCSNMSLSSALVDWLLTNGHATFVRNGSATLADGRTVTERIISIDHISLGGHTINNVEAGEGAPGQNPGDMLLGLGVLKRFGKFSIDTVGHQLVLG